MPCFVLKDNNFESEKIKCIKSLIIISSSSSSSISIMKVSGFYGRGVESGVGGGSIIYTQWNEDKKQRGERRERGKRERGERSEQRGDERR